RLASNSLLDGMVFGPRVVEAIDAGKDAPEPTGAMQALLGGPPDSTAIPGRVLDGAVDVAALPDDEPRTTAEARDRLQRAMTDHAGVLRDDESLDVALAEAVQAFARPVEDVASAEVHNLATLGFAQVLAAQARTETRGSHTRTDHPATDDDLELRFVVTAAPACRAERYSSTASFGGGSADGGFDLEVAVGGGAAGLLGEQLGGDLVDLAVLGVDV